MKIIVTVKAECEDQESANKLASKLHDACVGHPHSLQMDLVEDEPTEFH